MSPQTCLNEAQLLQLMGGALAPDEVSRVNAHLDGCRSCRELAAEIARLQTGGAREPTPSPEGTGPNGRTAAPGDLVRGATVGRYVVLELIGLGGMGTVYSAFDPELERKVALKLLRPDAITDDARQRLLREARAAAKITHPHVVAVHDVGSWNGQVFLTMELVHGETLRQWQRAPGRTREQIVHAYLAAGEGLLAAHQAGLVHRDFKPDNVLVDRTGRVQVTDFGLAKAAHALTPQDVLSPSDAERALEVTRSAVAAGTPAYMSPEQLAGTALDARSDQFSFCVALYEALYGEKPFAMSSLAELRQSLASGEVRPPPKGADVPDWLRRTLLRGLSIDPAARFASLEELLSELRRVRGWKRRTPWLASAAALVAIATSFAVVRYVDSRRALCSGGKDRLAEVWSADHRARAAAAFAATGDADAPDVWQRVSAALDAYGERWTSGHREACEATRVRGEQSEAVLDARMACLERRRRELGALVELLTRVEKRSVPLATTAAGRLPSVAECDGATVADRRQPMPSDEATRAQILKVEDDLAKVWAMHQLGQYADALKAAQRAEEAANATAYPPVHAESLVALGLLEQLNGKPTPATYHRAAVEALRGGAQVTAARAFHGLALMAGAQERRIEQALQWVDLADAAAIAANSPAAQASQAYTRGAFLYEAGDNAGALQSLRRAVELNEKLYGADNLGAAQSLATMASVLLNLGHPEEAFTAHRRADTIIERQLGPKHPHVSISLNNHGLSLMNAGRFEEALVLFDRALSIRKQVYGERHARTALPLMNIGETHHYAGDHQRALEVLRSAIEVSRTTKPPPLWEVAEATAFVVASLRELGRFDEAAQVKQSLLDELRQKFGEKDRLVAGALVSLAELQAAQGKHALAAKTAEDAYTMASALTDARLVTPQAARVAGEAQLRLGRLDDAFRLAEAAEAAAKSSTSDRHPSYADARALKALVLSARGDHDGAIALAEQAVSIREPYSGHALSLARARFVLGRTLAQAGRDPERARKLLSDARAVASSRDLVAHRALTADVDAALAAMAGQAADVP